MKVRWSEQTANGTLNELQSPELMGVLETRPYSN